MAAVPMGLYSLGAVLIEAGHQVSVANWHDRAPDPGALKRHLAKTRPDLIGFSILQANRWGGIDIARMVKALAPGIRIVFGGGRGDLPVAAPADPFSRDRFCGGGRGRTEFSGVGACSGSRWPPGRPPDRRHRQPKIRSALFCRSGGAGGRPGPSARSGQVFHFFPSEPDPGLSRQLPFLRVAAVLGAAGAVSLGRSFRGPDCPAL